MFEKKKLLLNCELCDTRKMKEEDYSHYEQIIMNAEVIIVNSASKSILSKLPIVNNVEKVLEREEEDICLQSINGSYEIGGTTSVSNNTILCVNGSLNILPKTEEVLKKYIHIFVNGSVRYPKSLEGYLSEMTVNGGSTCYPDDCVILDSSFKMDKYFPLRAKEGSKYYAESQVIVNDKSIDLQKLVQKKVQFVTNKLVVLESKLEDCIPIFDESVKFVVIPDDLNFVHGDAELNKDLLERYGNRLFLYGNLTLTDESIELCEKIEKLVVKGCVNLKQNHVEAFRAIHAEYDEINVIVVKNWRIFENRVSVTLDQSIFDHSPEGVLVKNTAHVKIKKDVTIETILEKLHIENCASVKCEEEQESAVHAVAENCAMIGSGQEEDKNLLGGILGGLKEMKDTKLINAQCYVL